MADRVITVTDPSVVTNDTLSGYNNYSDIDGQLGTTMTPTEATNGHTVDLSDGVVHEVTTKPVGTTNGEFSAVVSDPVTVDLSGGAVEPLPTGSVIALDVVSGNPLHQDLSGNNYHMVASNELNHTLPANPVSGMVTFDKSLINVTAQSSDRTLASTSSPFTQVININPTDLVSPTHFGMFFGDSASGNALYFENPNLAIRYGTTKDITQTPSILTQGADNILTFSRDSSNDCYFQVNNETPILLFGGSQINSTRLFRAFGGNIGYDSRCVDAKFGRMWQSNTYLTEATTPKLSEVKNWVSQKGF